MGKRQVSGEGTVYPEGIREAHYPITAFHTFLFQQLQRLTGQRGSYSVRLVHARSRDMQFLRQFFFSSLIFQTFRCSFYFAYFCIDAGSDCSGFRTHRLKRKSLKHKNLSRDLPHFTMGSRYAFLDLSV